MSNPARTLLAPAVAGLLLAWPCSSALAQNTGSVLGRVVATDTGQPLAGAVLELEGYTLRTLSADDGRFILVAVPPGEHSVRVSLLGYATVLVEGVAVRSGRPTRVDVELAPEALAVEGVTAEVQRIRLVEPDISATHEVVVGAELRELPLDAVVEAVELAPGVSDGHFRGGRIGQEVYIIDGLEFKNQLEASSQGSGLELPPTALEEVEVVTGGLGAQYGSALSGVVRYVTRRGDPEGWEARTSLRTDHWAPDAFLRGFTALSAFAGGPVGFLGQGATLYADVLLQGMLDADPRARGLTCLQAGDGDGALDGLVRQVQGGPLGGDLHCPYTAESFPHQQGDKVLAFLRLDRPLGPGANLTASLLRNRLQQQLYTSEFKYNPDHQLGQRAEGTLASLALDVIRQGRGQGYHVTARASAMRLDRYLGALDPWTFGERASFGGFGLSSYRFLGEDFVRRPIEEQLESGEPVPGYETPGGFTGSPFGPGGEGIFFTRGTPDIANWTRSEFVAGDLVGEFLTAERHALRGGLSGKLFRVETYERILAHLPGSSPNYARFYPGTLSGFGEVALAAADEFTVQLGARVEAFRAGLRFREDRADFLAPEADTEWQVSVMPRVAVTGPVPGTEGRTAFRFNYGRVAQPPDFQFFLDTSIGDSLRTDIRRQGNPNLSFERGTAYEVGLSHLLREGVAVSLVGFRKELSNLVTGALEFSGFGQGQFTTGDFGTVHGLEVSVRGNWPTLRLRAGYALQKATGVVSGALEGEDPGTGERGERQEFPLAFDRRHSGNVALFAGRAAGDAQRRWGASFLGAVKSGYPVERRPPDTEAPVLTPENLPWNVETNLRVSRELGRPPGCTDCSWRVLADVRNVLNRENVIALRRDTRSVAPPAGEVQRLVDEGTFGGPIPRESPRYSNLIDADGDGRISADEYFAARLAAALDRFDPSLFYGEAFQFRLGVEVSFR